MYYGLLAIDNIEASLLYSTSTLQIRNYIASGAGIPIVIPLHGVSEYACISSLPYHYMSCIVDLQLLY